MNSSKALSKLLQRRQKVDSAILALERLKKVIFGGPVGPPRQFSLQHTSAR